MPIYHQRGNSVGNHSYNAYFYTDCTYEPHFHKNLEILHVQHGRVELHVNNRSAVLTDGDFAFVLPNEIHSFRSELGARLWIGVFSEDFVQEFANYQRGKTGSAIVFRCSEQLMPLLSEQLIRRELTDLFLVKACLYLLCSEYLRQITLTENGGKAGSCMQRAADYVENNYRNEPSLSAAARVLGYDPCYFSRTFNRLFSIRFDQYVNIFRFNRACALLADTELPITQVSYESGFRSVRSFNEIFKRLAGISPSAYRAVPSARRPKLTP